MINPNKYTKVTGQVLSINFWLGEAVIQTEYGELVVDIGRNNSLAVHIGDLVRAEINYRIMTERFYGVVFKNLDGGF
jgi:hypothetical protein